MTKPISAAREPCVACGRETAAGSPRFASRRRIGGGEGLATYLCFSCDDRLTTRTGQRMTDDKVRWTVERGSIAALDTIEGRFT